MVGPGTGVAPFRAFVQERRATEASGRSWLFFGDRTFTHDFLYQLEWQDALKDGALTRMESRSRATRRRRSTSSTRCGSSAANCRWLDSGASFYVSAMPRHGEGRARDAGARYADVKALSPEAAEQAVATSSAKSATCRIPTDPAIGRPVP